MRQKQTRIFTGSANITGRGWVGFSYFRILFLLTALPPLAAMETSFRMHGALVAIICA